MVIAAFYESNNSLIGVVAVDSGLLSSRNDALLLVRLRFSSCNTYIMR